MDNKYRPLHKIKIGEKSFVYDLNSTGSDRRRMLDLGIIGGTEIEALYKSPSGDPTAYNIRGAVIALRKEDAENIIVTNML